MKNLVLLFQKNNLCHIKPKIEKGIIRIQISSEDRPFSGIEIKKILNVVNSIHEYYKGTKIPIYFYFNEVTFIDKLTYIFVECICYYLIKVYNTRVQIFMRVEKDIGTEGIVSSPLLLLNETSNDKVKMFIEKFHKDTYGYHYRRVVDSHNKEGTNYLGDIYEEVDSFLKVFGIDNDCRDDVSLVVSELIGNSAEHANSDCLVDIDVTREYNKTTGKKLDDNYYYGLNIVIMNFSEKLLGNDIGNNILDCDKNGFSDRYKMIFDTFENHRSMFNEDYKEEDFRNITAFQKKISGRIAKFNTGGTGLAKFIKSLEERSEAYRCYVISGGRCINFYSKMLEYDEDGWIGFNCSHNYLSGIPGEDVTTDCFIYMPGTAYNFNFIMKGDKIFDE